MSGFSSEGKHFYEVECKMDLEATVTIVVAADSPEEAIAHIEEHRSYPLSLDWKIIVGEPQQITDGYITEIGEAFTSAATKRGVPTPDACDPTSKPEEGHEGLPK